MAGAFAAFVIVASLVPGKGGFHMLENGQLELGSPLSTMRVFEGVGGCSVSLGPAWAFNVPRQSVGMAQPGPKPSCRQQDLGLWHGSSRGPRETRVVD